MSDVGDEFEVAGFKPGVFEAGADLSALQFRAVKLDGSGNVVLCGAGERALAMLQNKPILGESAEIDMDGITKAEAGAAYAVNVQLMSDANGRLITATSGNRVVAHSLKPAAALGDKVSVKVIGLAGALLA